MAVHRPSLQMLTIVCGDERWTVPRNRSEVLRCATDGPFLEATEHPDWVDLGASVADGCLSERGLRGIVRLMNEPDAVDEINAADVPDVVTAARFLMVSPWNPIPLMRSGLRRCPPIIMDVLESVESARLWSDLFGNAFCNEVVMAFWIVTPYLTADHLSRVPIDALPHLLGHPVWDGAIGREEAFVVAYKVVAHGPERDSALAWGSLNAIAGRCGRRLGNVTIPRVSEGCLEDVDVQTAVAVYLHPLERRICSMWIHRCVGPNTCVSAYKRYTSVIGMIDFDYRLDPEDPHGSILSVTMPGCGSAVPDLVTYEATDGCGPIEVRLGERNRIQCLAPKIHMVVAFRAQKL